MLRKIFSTKQFISDAAIEELQAEKFHIVWTAKVHSIHNDFHLTQKIKDSFGILCSEVDTIDKDILDAAGPELKIISTINTSFDHIDIEECKRRNIVVTNVPEKYTGSIAEYAIGLLLTVGRRIAEASNFTKSFYCTKWKHKPFSGKILKGSQVGFLGMKKSGLEILKRITLFGVKACYYHDEEFRNIEAGLLGASYLPFEELLKKSDFVISSYNFGNNTKPIFRSTTFDLMKNDAVFIHIGSAEPSQLETLYDALINEKIGAAGLDIVLDKHLDLIRNLVSLPNVVVSPYVSSTEFNSYSERSVLAARNIIRFAKGESLNYAVY